MKLNCTRYRFEIAPELSPEQTLILLRKQGFVPIPADSDTKESRGWTGYDNLLDSRLERSRFDYGPFLAFGLRIDMKSPSDKVISLESDKEVQAAQDRLKAQIKEAGLVPQEHGEKHNRPGELTKERIAEIRQSVRNRILRQTLPDPSLYPILWFLDNQDIAPRNELWLMSTAPGARAAFESLITATIEGARVVQVDAGHVCSSVEMGPVDLVSGFLTHAMTVAEHNAPLVFGEDGLPVGYYSLAVGSGASVCTKDNDGKAEVSMSVTDRNCIHLQARQLIQDGGKVVTLDMEIREGDRAWPFKLATDYSLKALQLPELELDERDADDPDTRLIETVREIGKTWNRVDYAIDAWSLQQ